MVEQREHGLIQADEKIQSQEQQLIEQNMKIEELQKALKVSRSSVKDLVLFLYKYSLGLWCMTC